LSGRAGSPGWAGSSSSALGAIGPVAAVGPCGPGGPGCPGETLKSLRASGPGCPDETLRPLRTLRSFGSSGTSKTLEASRPLLSRKTLEALRPLRTHDDRSRRCPSSFRFGAFDDAVVLVTAHLGRLLGLRSRRYCHRRQSGETGEDRE
jgi:hypothetical protein